MYLYKIGKDIFCNRLPNWFYLFFLSFFCSECCRFFADHSANIRHWFFGSYLICMRSRMNRYNIIYPFVSLFAFYTAPLPISNAHACASQFRWTKNAFYNYYNDTQALDGDGIFVYAILRVAIFARTKWKCSSLNSRRWFVFFSFSKCHTDKNLALLLEIFCSLAAWMDTNCECAFFPFYSGTIKLDKKWDGSIVGKMFVICSLVVLQFMRFLLHLPPLSGRVLFSSQFVFYFSFFHNANAIPSHFLLLTSI